MASFLIPAGYSGNHQPLVSFGFGEFLSVNVLIPDFMLTRAGVSCSNRSRQLSAIGNNRCHSSGPPVLTVCCNRNLIKETT
jgi:hypothetical protein